MEKKLRKFASVLKNSKICFSSRDFRDVKVNSGDFVYADPPYLITEATYNENKGWTKNDEIALYDFLDEVDKMKAKFALSNVIIHKGNENEILKNWAEKYNLYILNHNYNNSNYHSKAKYSKTVEVLVTNYEYGK